MKKDGRFFEIGVLSKLTGVHARCLRYYEQLGILQPAYVDGETSYRYYTYRHIRIIEAIQYCVELGIPLKEFSRFYSGAEGTIDYAALVAYGKQITEEKLKKILQRQRFVEDMSVGMSHAKACREKGRCVCVLPEAYYYCRAYDVDGDIAHFQSEMLKMIDELHAQGFHAGYDNGILLRTENGVGQYYLFVNVKEMDEADKNRPEIVKIPQGEYLCVVCEKSEIANAQELFRAQFAAHPTTLITETELFLENFRYEEPLFELRFYLGGEPLTV